MSFFGGSSSVAAGNKGAPTALSEGLQKLGTLSLKEQAAWWRETARELGPMVYGNPRADFDSVGRYWDGTWRGVKFMVECAVGSGGHLRREELCALLADRFGFLSTTDREVALQSSGFQRLCDVVLCEDKPEVALASFYRAIRDLRVGALLDMPRSQGDWMVYYYDYDNNNISGSFVRSSKKQKSFRGEVWVEEPVVEPQSPCGQGAVGFDDMDEFLIADPWKRRGAVHWVHMHRQCQELLLALGQQYQLRVHAQCLLARLEEAQPQAEVTLDNWSSVVFPAVYLDKEARCSLEEYQRWFNDKAAEARLAGYQGRKLPKCKKMIPPSITVGVVHLNLSVLWSKQEDSTVLSVAAKPQYVARWSSWGDEGLSWCLLPGLCGFVSRRWRLRRFGYTLLPQSEDLEAADCEDLEEEMQESLERKFKELELVAEAEGNTTFELTFGPVLKLLNEDHSILRMGSHTQLVYRMLLNRTAEYLDVVAIYAAALARLQALLNDQEHPRKHDLITKVTVAKLELESLLRIVEPFAHHVLPVLQHHTPPDSEDALPSRVIRHHKCDMENNVRQFLQACQAQIRLCESLTSEYDRKSADRVNRILNFLTIVTFLVMPVQLLTGLYGMNFVHMPELGWHYGYHYFFGLAATSCFLVACFLLCIYRTGAPHSG